MEFSRLYGNPAHPAYFADPFVFRHAGKFLAIGAGEPSMTQASDRIFPTLQSDDFVTWTSNGAALNAPDEMLEDFKAPEIVEAGGKFFLYYSAIGVGKGCQLRVAVSDAPLGPYQDTGEPLLDPQLCPNATDPNPFLDEDGKWYLLYVRDHHLVLAPLLDMLKVPNEFTVIATPSHAWQNGILSGPSLIRHGSRYYCIFSGGKWQDEEYGLDYVWSESIEGPYVDDSHNGPRLLKTVAKRVVGPGHNSVVLGPNGITQYIAYHAWDAEKVARRLCFDVLDWTPEGPRCQGPTWEPKVVYW